MEVFQVGVINDNRPAASEYACGVEVLVCAESRVEATIALRKRGFGGVHARALRPVTPGHLDQDGRPLPTPQPGEIWARTVYVPGEWERR